MANNEGVSNEEPRITKGITKDSDYTVKQKITDIKREIYLTFDDGIEAGTEEVVDLLDSLGVRGTFFLIGKRIESAYARDPEGCARILGKIYNNHVIGNHSYSHANEFYTSFYEDGVKIALGNDKADRRSAVDDFEKAKRVIDNCLENELKIPLNTKLYPTAKNQKKGVLRFPGTNTWYDLDEDKPTNVHCAYRNGLWAGCQEDTKAHAKKLAENYSVFGWDCEWKMTPSELVGNKVRASINSITKDEDYHNLDYIDPFIDYYSKDNISINRPTADMDMMRRLVLDYAYKSRIKPFDSYGLIPGKVVLLMHERQFRKGRLENDEVNLNDTSELEKLSEFIKYFISIKAEFKTLDEY